jgi:hypothetical protein
LPTLHRVQQLPEGAKAVAAALHLAAYYDRHVEHGRRGRRIHRERLARSWGALAMG